MNCPARELSATDLGAAPPGHRWVWIDAMKGWRIVADPVATPLASPPVRLRDLGPFEVAVRRRKPLPADHAGVVAVGTAVRRIR